MYITCEYNVHDKVIYVWKADRMSIDHNNCILCKHAFISIVHCLDLIKHVMNPCTCVYTFSREENGSIEYWWHRTIGKAETINS